MTLLVDTDRLRRILTASLPSGARAAELFIESRLGLHVEMTMGAGAAEPVLRVERRWEAGAHLRRFFEGRHESFVLDAPAPETLEALAVHPESLCVEWLSGSVPMGVPGIRAQPGSGGERLEARLADASPSGRDGPWSGAQLAVASALLERWLASVAAAPARAGSGAPPGATGWLDAQVQEILVLATDRDPARDTRRFVDATLRARPAGGDRWPALEETRSAASVEGLLAASDPAAALTARLAGADRAVDSCRGTMPVVFASPSGGFLLHEICGHLLEADHVLRGASPFAGARGRQIASSLLNLADDGSIRGMRGSTLFDDEGVAARRTPLIMDGTLVGYLSDRLTAFATDGISTGNGRRQSYRDAPMPRMTNLVIDPGGESFEQILARTGWGLLVTRLGRGRVDPASGRFALAVEEAFLIEDGRAGAPVRGAVLRGVAGDLLPSIDAVGNDAVADSGAPQCLKEDQALPFGILQPTLRVASMMVA